MADQRTVWLNKKHNDEIDDMVERGVAENPSEATRLLIDAGESEYGYDNGEYSETALQVLLKEIGKLTFVVGMTMLTFTLFYPAPFRAISLLVVVTGTATFIVGERIQRYEPAITDRLKNVVGGETA